MGPSNHSLPCLVTRLVPMSKGAYGLQICVTIDEYIEITARSRSSITESRDSLVALTKLLTPHVPYGFRILGSSSIQVLAAACYQTSTHHAKWSTIPLPISNIPALSSSSFLIWTTSYTSSCDSRMFDLPTERRGKRILARYLSASWTSPVSRVQHMSLSLASSLEGDSLGTVSIPWHPCRRFNTPVCGTSFRAVRLHMMVCFWR